MIALCCRCRRDDCMGTWSLFYLGMFQNGHWFILWWIWGTLFCCSVGNPATWGEIRRQRYTHSNPFETITPPGKSWMCWHGSILHLRLQRNSAKELEFVQSAKHSDFPGNCFFERGEVLRKGIASFSVKAKPKCQINWDWASANSILTSNDRSISLRPLWGVGGLYHLWVIIRSGSIRIPFNYLKGLQVLWTGSAGRINDLRDRPTRFWKTYGFGYPYQWKYL